MRWKSVIKTIIIIFAFFLITIECRTDVIAAETTKAKEALAETYTNDKINNTIKLFRGDFDNEELIYDEYAVDKYYDETDEAYLTRMLKICLKEQDGYVVGIPNDASIKKIELITNQDLIIIHMSQGYELTHYGSLGEGLMLKSLVNTVTHYFNVHKAIIKIEGKPYSSGHFSFEENEFLTSLE